MRFQIIILSLFSASMSVSSEMQEVDKLDAVLEQLKHLRQDVVQLGNRVQNLEQQLSAAAVDGAVAKTSLQESADDSIIDRMVEAVHFREEAMNSPWMNTELWNQLDEGLSKEEVLKILGEPSTEDPSLKRWIDTVYTYSGRRPSSGERVVGKVRFYKGKVVDIEPPR